MTEYFKLTYKNITNFVANILQVKYFTNLKQMSYTQKINNIRKHRFSLLLFFVCIKVNSNYCIKNCFRNNFYTTHKAVHTYIYITRQTHTNTTARYQQNRNRKVNRRIYLYIART